MDYSKKKKFPLNYPSDVLNIIDAMAYNSKNVVLSGSASLTSQLYPADYDMSETVKSNAELQTIAIKSFVSGFQDNIRKVLRLKNTYIGDIKCGSVEEWKVITGDVSGGKVVGYDYEAAFDKLNDLGELGVLSAQEVRTAHRLLKKYPSVSEFLTIAKEIRPNVVRWTVADVMRGFVVLRTGERFTLADGITSPSVSKLDVVSYVNGRFTDFSIIYTYKYKSKTLNAVNTDIEQEIKKEIVAKYAAGDYYKMSKRIYSILLRKNPTTKNVKLLSAMFNGDLGRLYSIISDIGTLIFLFENKAALPIEKVRSEISNFRGRIGFIDDDKINSKRVLEALLSVESAKKSKVLHKLISLQDELINILNDNAETELSSMGFIPLPSYLQH